MTPYQLLNNLQGNTEIRRYFHNLQIIDGNKVVGFYKTRVVKYKNRLNQNISYLFPATFSVVNGYVTVTMTFGSVERGYNPAYSFNGKNEYNLYVLDVQSHLYGLLAAKRHISISEFLNQNYHQEMIRYFVNTIQYLDEHAFPFMRIAHQDSKKSYKSFY